MAQTQSARTHKTKSNAVLADSAYAKQIDAEREAVRLGAVRYRRLAREAVERGDAAALAPAERFCVMWFAPLLFQLELHIAKMKNGQQGQNYQHVWPIVKQMDPDRLAVITMHDALGALLLHPQGVTLARLAYCIGQSVLGEIHLDRIKKDHRDSYDRMIKRMRRFSPKKVNWWAKKELSDHQWERRVCNIVGTWLLDNLISTASVSGYEEGKAFERAFLHTQKFYRKHKTGFVVLSPKVHDLIDEGHIWRETLRPRLVPMLTEPMKWSDEIEGGYLQVRTKLVSKVTPWQKNALKVADLSRVHKGVNAMNATRWKILTPVLDVINRLWEQGGATSGIPRADELPLPPRPHDISENAAALKKWKREAEKVYDERVMEKGIRANFLMLLSIANNYAEEDCIHLPHFLDFRSRVYAASLLNHQGEDLWRAIFGFADKKPLTTDGEKWLRIHAANCWGHDQCSLEDRIAWANEHMAGMLSVAHDPFANDSWQQADKPFQFLASCLAFADDDMAQHLAVQIDGKANVLQQIMALLKDPDGAEIVNLIDTDQPNDPYGVVVDVVKELVAKDAASDKEYANMVVEHISRSVLKTAIMAKFYAMTQHGAASAIRKKLEKLGLPKSNKKVFAAAQYLAKMTYLSLGEVFAPAMELMAWVRGQCREIIKAYPTDCLSWTTPIGFPVCQPYRKDQSVRVRTMLQVLRIAVVDETMPARLGKNINGSMANWIHSFDGSHMLMAASASHEDSLAFGGIHDCALSHASDIPALSGVLRDTFVELHAPDWVGIQANEWAERYPRASHLEPPVRGSFDINLVKTATYAFT